MNSSNTPNVTSSPESADSHSRSGSPAGLTNSRCGQAHVRVSRFRSQDSTKAMPTNDTCGQLFTRSSKSASLQLSLVSRLQVRMAANGWPQSALTWREVDMPSGVPIFALRLSESANTAKDYSSLPCLSAQNQSGGLRMAGGSGGLKKWKSIGGMPTGAKAVRLACWMMGYPTEWLRCLSGDLETRLCHKPRPNLSARP